MPFGWITNLPEKFNCYLCWNVFHSAKSHITVVQWPTWTSIIWAQETPLMCIHLKWFQMMEKMRGNSIGLLGLIQLRGIWKYDTKFCISYMRAVKHMYEMQLWPMLRNKLTQMHFSAFFSASSTLKLIEWMTLWGLLKGGSGTVPGQTITLLTVRPHLCLATVLVQQKFAWQLPDPESLAGCQPKLWPLRVSRRRKEKKNPAPTRKH